MATEAASKTVLVVEDKEIECQALAFVIRGEGYRVLTAANATEAFEHLRRSPAPDLVLLDMIMPDTDGWHFLRHFRRDQEFAAIPIVITTGMDIASPDWAAALGAASLIQKPIDLDQLRQELDRLLNGMPRKNRSPV